MPAANDVVWLDVLPSMKGFGPALTKGSAGASATAGAASGRAFGKSMLAGIAIVAGGAALATKALYNIGATFDDMTDTIRVGTGATGQALDDLRESAKRVGSDIPASFEDVGTAIADVNTRLGLTGKPLEDITGQFLELSRITDTDVATNIANVTRVFGDWNVATEDQGDTLDYLFKVSQTTGIGIEDLSSKVVQFGAPMRQLGFSFEQSAALIGKFEKEGVNSNKVMAGMQQSLGRMAKAGKDPQKEFARLTAEMQNAGSAGEANAIAIELFGTRAGPDMAAAVREGRFELDDLMSTLANSDETIMKAGEDTQDFSEQWAIFKNRVMVGLEPLATKVFNALGKGMDWMNSTGVPVLRDMAGFVKDNSTAFKILGGVVGTLAGVLVAYALTMKVVSAATRAWTVLTNIATAAKTAFTWAVQLAGRAAIGTRIQLALMSAQTVAATVASKVARGATLAWAAGQWLLNAALTANPIGLVIAAIAALVAGVIWAYKNVGWFRKGVDAAFSWLKGAVVATIGFVKKHWRTIVSIIGGPIGLAIAHFDKISAAAGKVRDVFGSVVGGIRTRWNKLSGIVQKPIDAAIKIINGFVKLVNKIPGVNLPLILGSAKSAPSGVAVGALRRATGGPIIGPGTGTSDDVLMYGSNGEHMWTKREVDALGGHGKMKALRNAVLAGAVHIPAFAKGGPVVPGRGNRHTSGYPWATYAGDFPNPIGTPVRAWKAGAIALVRTLAGSYGKHIRMNHGDGTSSLYAHLSRFFVKQGQRVAQGAKIGAVGSTGNSTGPHLHFETMGGPYKGGGGVVSSIWDTLKGASGRLTSMIKKHLLDKANIGGLFGNARGLFSHIGNGIKKHVTGKLFDNGGWLMPGQSAINLSSKPEPVFSGTQWKAISTAIRPALDGQSGGTTSRPVTGIDGKAVMYLIEDHARDVAYLALAEHDAHNGQLTRQGVR